MFCYCFVSTESDSRATEENTAISSRRIGRQHHNFDYLEVLVGNFPKAQLRKYNLPIWNSKGCRLPNPTVIIQNF